MNSLDKIRFNGNLYPCTVVEAYDYDKNKDIKVKVSTVELQNDLINALKSTDENIRKNAMTFDSDVKYFLPKNDLVSKTYEQLCSIVSKMMSND